MILIGKAKQDFLGWGKKQKDLNFGIQVPNTIGGVIFYMGSNLEILPEKILNYLIIEWLDSLGIEIFLQAGWNFSTNKRDGIDVEIIHKDGLYHICAENRQEATTEAIKKANEIYNNNYDTSKRT